MEEENKISTEYFEISLREDGIVLIKALAKKWNEKTMDDLTEKYAKIIKKMPQKPKVLIDLTLSIPIPSLSIRKGIVEKMKYVASLGFDKVAMFGGNAIIKVTTLFAIAASRIKNFRRFDTEEEALKWLKGK